MKECPYCKKKNNENAIKCKHCGSYVEIDEKMIELFKEYRVRENKWAEKSLEQLSFLNNLMCGIGIGFITLMANNKENALFYKWPIMVISISVIFGIWCALNRLRDFRITRHIDTTRRRVYEFLGQTLNGSISDDHNILEAIKVLFPLAYDPITKDQCKEYADNTSSKEAVNNNFIKLRRISHLFGKNTWALLYIQLVFFLIGIVLFLVMITNPIGFLKVLIASLRTIRVMDCKLFFYIFS